MIAEPIYEKDYYDPTRTGHNMTAIDKKHNVAGNSFRFSFN